MLTVCRTLPWMASFASITVEVGQALTEDALDRLTLDFASHTPREKYFYFRTCGRTEAAKNLRVQTPDIRVVDLYKVPLSAVFPMSEQDESHVHKRSPCQNNQTWARLV